MMNLTPFEAGLMLHLVADWLLQNEWMAVNKVRFMHPAAWIHGSIHGILLGLVFGWLGGVVLALGLLPHSSPVAPRDRDVSSSDAEQ